MPKDKDVYLAGNIGNYCTGQGKQDMRKQQMNNGQNGQLPPVEHYTEYSSLNSSYTTAAAYPHRPPPPYPPPYPPRKPPPEYGYPQPPPGWDGGYPPTDCPAPPPEPYGYPPQPGWGGYGGGYPPHQGTYILYCYYLSIYLSIYRH